MRKTIDCLGATFCLVNTFPLLHTDRDFDQTARVLPLQLFIPDLVCTAPIPTGVTHHASRLTHSWISFSPGIAKIHQTNRRLADSRPPDKPMKEQTQ